MTRAALVGGAIALWCAVAAAAPQRPAGAPTGDAVAEVHLRIGAGSTLRAAGKDYAATPGTALLRSDELVVPAGQVLVVKLRNGYLVRLDDDITLPVGKIVLIDAPRTSESLGSQIERLLTREEQGRAERIAGAHAQLNGTQSGDLRPAENKGATESPPSGSDKGEANKPSAPLGRQEPMAAATPPLPKASAPSAAPHAEPGTPGDGREKVSRDASRRKTLAAATLSRAELKSCLARELGKLPVKLKTAPLRLYVHGGLIERAHLGGGLVLPECARPLLVGAPSDGAEGRWLQVELPLR